MSLSAAPMSGFSHPALQSADAFRHVLEAMSRPGRIQSLTGLEQAPEPLHRSTAILMLTLADTDTPVWLDAPFRVKPILDFLHFHCGCPIIPDRARASFAVLSHPGQLERCTDFSLGTADYPDRSATLIIQVDALHPAGNVSLTGPGVEERHSLGIAPDAPSLWSALTDNHRRFPLGIDVIFAAPHAIAALPRSTAIALKEPA